MGFLSVVVIAGVVTVFPVPAQTEPEPASQPPAGPSEDARWFVTDSEFIRRDQASPEVLRQSPWTLAVDSSAGSEELRKETAWLFHDGEHVASEVTSFSPEGLPVERRRTDADGLPIFTETYRYRFDNSLREVRRCDSSNRCVTIQYGFPRESWDESVMAPEYLSVHLYDRLGRPEYIRREEEGTTVEEEWLTYDETGLTGRRVRRNGEEAVYRYMDGAVVSEEHRRNGRLFREVSRRFDDDGHIVEETVQSGGTVRQDTWFREDDDSYRMLREVDGVRTIVESRDASGTGVTIRYEEGREVVREYFQEGELQRREIIVEGRPVRTDLQ